MVRNTIAASAKASAKIEAFPTIKVRTFADHVPGPAPVTIVRKSAAALTATEQQTFMNAITSAIADGAYSTLVRIHAIMSHDMHTMPGRPAGTQRFLPWHRLYLINFEQDMRRFEPTFFVPYWHWMDQSHIPDWMTGFKPKGVTDANGKPIVVTRRPGTNPQAPTLPTSHTIRTTVMNHTVYTPFTLALEGAQPFGAHNLVHDWFGRNTTMWNVPKSPADPMFWMHHAEIDRIWWLWKQSHPTQNPHVSGADAVLDPWPEHVSDVLSIAAGSHPYSYDRTQL
jgi:tyrosinase